MTTTPQTIPSDPPAELRRRTIRLVLILIPAIVLSGWLVLSARRNPWQNQVARQAIPATLTETGRTWTSVDVSLSELEMTILETRDYLMRTYADGRGNPVDLCIIFSEDNRKGTHPPDVCLEGGGSRIVSKHERVIDAPGGPVAARELVTMMGNTPVYVCYFYKCGDSFTPSFYRQQAMIIWNGLLHRNSGGALVRYTMKMNSTSDLAGARQRTDELVRVTMPYIRDRLK